MEPIAKTSSSDDQVVLFLHAFPLNADMWQSQVEAVRNLGWKPIVPNMPDLNEGGTSSRLEAFATTALKALDAAGAQKAVVVGLSMGGYVAFRLLAQAPERLRGLVLADTKASADLPEKAKSRLELAERVEREGVAWLTDALMPTLVAAHTSDEVKEQLRAMIRRANPQAVAVAARAMASRPDSSPLLEKIEVPTLVISGSEDTIVTLTESAFMAKAIPQAELQVIAGAGHLSNLEAPEAFNNDLCAFLKKLA